MRVLGLAKHNGSHNTSNPWSLEAQGWFQKQVQLEDKHWQSTWMLLKTVVAPGLLKISQISEIFMDIYKQ